MRQPSGGVGLRIDGGLNQPILAAADGKVVYTGNGLLGYGQLVIINHVRGWLTAYGHNAFVQVKEGDEVRAGQQHRADGARARANGRCSTSRSASRATPLDPLTQLPPR